MELLKLQSLMGWLKRQAEALGKLERDPKKLALGVSLGVYIAFSPFIGFHTILVFLGAWLFRIHVGILLSVSMLINNPWTMVPVYGAGYWFGDWLLTSFYINHHGYNPAWVTAANGWIHTYIPGDGFSLWAFLIGGNILGIVFGIISYPLSQWLMTVWGTRSKEQVLRTMMRSKQALHRLQTKAAPMVERVKATARERRAKYEISSSK